MIFADSQDALKAIASVCCKSRLVRKCKESLRTFGPDRIRLCWVPGHSGILGNETSEALVRLEVRHQVKIQKVFLWRFPLSRFLAEILRVNKIVMKSFSKKDVVRI